MKKTEELIDRKTWKFLAITGWTTLTLVVLTALVLINHYKGSLF